MKTDVKAPDRTLTVQADGQEIAAGCRLRLRGRETLGLAPDLFVLDIRNLPDTAFHLLSRAKTLTVKHGEAVLAAGEMAEVFRRTTPEGTRTTAAFAPGLSFWESAVSLSVPAGRSTSETIRLLLAAARPGTAGPALAEPGAASGFRLLSFSAADPVFSRGQSFHGRAADAVKTVLSACGAEAVWVPAGLKVIGRTAIDSVSGTVRIAETDFIDVPYPASGGWVLPLAPAGWQAGLRAAAAVAGTEIRGLIRERLVDADTESGPWRTELLLEC